MICEWTSAGARCTEALGGALAELLRPGDLVVLRGDLGAGKTTLVRAVARALGVTGPVTSPTFTVAQRYQGRVPVAHMDAYRVGQADEEDAEMLADALGGGAIAFVEWPDAVADLLPAPRIAVDIAHGGRDTRLVRLAAADPETAEALARICDHLRARHLHRRPERRPDAR